MQATEELSTTQTVARILIVDDHPTVREGLAIRISRQPDLAVCGEAADVVEALQLIEENPPDVVVVDIALKTGNGLDLIKRLKAKHPSVRALVWSMYDESLYASRALQAGALGYITKEQATEDIIAAIRHVLAGKVYLSKAMADVVLQQTVGAQPAAAVSIADKLSDREMAVFRLLGRGFDTHRIAAKLSVSPKTVETYRARIKQKLNLRKNNELIQQAVQWLLEHG